MWISRIPKLVSFGSRWHVLDRRNKKEEAPRFVWKSQRGQHGKGTASLWTISPGKVLLVSSAKPPPDVCPHIIFTRPIRHSLREENLVKFACVFPSADSNCSSSSSHLQGDSPIEIPGGERTGSEENLAAFKRPYKCTYPAPYRGYSVDQIWFDVTREGEMFVPQQARLGKHSTAGSANISLSCCVRVRGSPRIAPSGDSQDFVRIVDSDDSFGSDRRRVICSGTTFSDLSVGRTSRELHSEKAGLPYRIF